MMPSVGGKKYAYDEKGMKDAAAARKKLAMKMAAKKKVKKK
jgi:hypothetical protein